MNGHDVTWRGKRVPDVTFSAQGGLMHCLGAVLETVKHDRHCWAFGSLPSWGKGNTEH